MEAAAEGGSIALSPAAVGGRHGRSSKKLKLVKKKTVRRMLKKLGMKMRGGAGAAVVPAATADAVKSMADGAAPAATGGRRKSHKRSARRGKSLFGMRF